MATWHGISKDPQSSCDSRNHSSLRENCREKSRIGHRIKFFLTCSTPPGVLCEPEQYKAKIEQAIHSWIQDTSIWLRVYMQGPLAAIDCKYLWPLFDESNCGAIANLDSTSLKMRCCATICYCISAEALTPVNRFDASNVFDLTFWAFSSIILLIVDVFPSLLTE